MKRVIKMNTSKFMAVNSTSEHSCLRIQTRVESGGIFNFNRWEGRGGDNTPMLRSSSVFFDFSDDDAFSHYKHL